MREKHLFLAERKASGEGPCGYGSVPCCSPADGEPELWRRGGFQRVLGQDGLRCCSRGCSLLLGSCMSYSGLTMPPQ